MSSVSLYTSNNTRINLLIGSVIVGGGYSPTTQNIWSCNGNNISGVVNGVTVPSTSHYVDWSYNTIPPTLSKAGTNIVSALGSYIANGGSTNFYVKEDQTGSYFTISKDASGNINNIVVHSGSYTITYSISNIYSAEEIYFVYAENAGLSRYDNLCFFFKSAYNDVHSYGLHFGGLAHLNAVFTNSTSNNIQERFNSGTTLNPDPGNRGFRPIGDLAQNPLGGGDISGERPGYTTDILTQPGAPDESVASAVGSGFVNVYQLNEANLQRLGLCLFDGLLSKLNNIFMNPLDSIVSLQVFPCSPDLGAQENIKVLKWRATLVDLGGDAVGNRLAKQFKVFDFGSLAIPEMWFSYLDYEATSFTLYLPFIGMVDIPVNEVMDGIINVQYTVDFITGMCVANVLCTKHTLLASGATANQYSQHCYMGNCSVQIPLNAVSFGNIVGAFAQAASVGLTTGLAGAAASLTGSAINGSMKPIVETKGTINSNAGFCGVLQPYITITRPVPVEPESYQQTVGYPSFVSSRLADCQDLCVCDSIDLKGISGATESELQRIRQLCSEGVYV